MPVGEAARRFFSELQRQICRELEAIDGEAVFGEDPWRHGPEGESGGGLTRVLVDGGVFEKAAVNFSAVEGDLPERLAARLGVPARPFKATGLSLVLHPRSPMVPTAHMNVRYLSLGGEGEARSWFGGGTDLTPYYLFEEDAVHFHRCLKEVCDRHDVADYRRFKKACDEYFHLAHRDEARGVGGIFFDYLADDLDAVFGFVQEVGRVFLPSYLPIVRRRIDEPWSEREREWQLVRRGRYVEFNLIHDRGTLFGLETRGRTESILVSLPPAVRWAYGHEPPGEREESLLKVLREPVDWV